MIPPKNSATATSTPDSDDVGWPEPAAVVLVIMCRRMTFAFAARSWRDGALMAGGMAISLKPVRRHYREFSRDAKRSAPLRRLRVAAKPGGPTTDNGRKRKNPCRGDTGCEEGVCGSGEAAEGKLGKRRECRPGARRFAHDPGQPPCLLELAFELPLFQPHFG